MDFPTGSVIRRKLNNLVLIEPIEFISSANSTPAIVKTFPVKINGVYRLKMINEIYFVTGSTLDDGHLSLYFTPKNQTLARGRSITKVGSVLDRIYHNVTGQGVLEIFTITDISGIEAPGGSKFIETEFLFTAGASETVQLTIRNIGSGGNLAYANNHLLTLERLK